MIERGTHPKMKFRANLKDQQRRDMELIRQQRKERRERFNSQQQEEKAYRAVFDKLVQARQSTGQNANISYDTIRETLKKQSRLIKSQFKCERVKFRVSIQDGKAKMKAVPIKDDE